MADSAASRLTELRNEIGHALGRGEFPENQLREFRFLWRTTPNQEKDGLGFNLQDIEDMVKDLRRETSTNAGQYRRVPVTTVRVKDN